jgi:hypothetical protein
VSTAAEAKAFTMNIKHPSGPAPMNRAVGTGSWLQLVRPQIVPWLARTAAQDGRTGATGDKLEEWKSGVCGVSTRRWTTQGLIRYERGYEGQRPQFLAISPKAQSIQRFFNDE